MISLRLKILIETRIYLIEVQTCVIFKCIICYTFTDHNIPDFNLSLNLIIDIPNSNSGGSMDSLENDFAEPVCLIKTILDLRHYE